MKSFFIKIYGIGIIIGVLLAIAALTILYIYNTVRIDLATLEPYKIVKETKTEKIHLYRDRIVIKKYVEPVFDRKTWIWIKMHYKEKKDYFIVDKNNNVWHVGNGVYPKPTWTEIIIPLENKLSITELLSKNSGYKLDVYTNYPPAKCTYYNMSISGYNVPIMVLGTYGGTINQIVDWWVIKNKYYKEEVLDDDGWTVYNITSENIDDKNYTIDFTAYWTTNSITYTDDCSVPYGTNIISTTLGKDFYQFNNSYGQGIAVQTQLPSTPATYYFVYIAKFIVNLNGTEYKLTRVVYAKVIINDGSGPPENPIARAIWNVGNFIRRALVGIGTAIVNGLKAIMPEQLKQLLSDVWHLFNTFIDFFTAAINLTGKMADYFKLILIMIPLIMVSIMLYNPILVIDFINWLIDLLKRIVEFIRNLLPI